MIQDGQIGFCTEVSILYTRSMELLLVFELVSHFSMHQSTLTCSPGPLLKKGLYHGLDALTKTGRSM